MAPRIRACGRLTDVRVVAAPDKFRGTARAPEVAAAIGEAAWEAGWESTEVPLSDGGEGLLDAFGGANRSTLYISTATLATAPEELQQLPNAGALFEVELPTRGLVSPRFSTT